MKTFVLMVLLLLPIFIFSCSKPDETAPVVNIINPVNNQVLAASQPINIKAEITDETGIHMVHAMVIDNSNNGHLLHTEDHVDTRNFELNKSFTAMPGRSYTIEVGAMDHAHNKDKTIIVISTN